MADESLTFDIVGRDRLSAKVHFMGEQVERLTHKLERLDHKRAEPKVDIDVDKPLRKVEQFGDGSQTILSGAFRIVTSHAIVMGAAIVGALAAAPAAAALAATGIVLGLGGGLAAIGIAAAAQSEKVKKAFTGLKDHVVKQVKEMAAPFEPFLLHVADVGRRVFNVFAKPLQDSFAKLAPALTVFSDQLGTAFSNLAPMIGPVTDAFTAILRQLGPRLPALFKSIGDSIAHIAKVVADNADTFAGLVNFFLRMIPVAVDLTAKLASFFAMVVRNAPAVAEATLGAAELVLKGVRVLTGAILDFFGSILDGAVKAFGWVPKWGSKLRDAQTAFNTFRGGVGAALDGAIAKVDSWRRAADRMPKRIKLEGEIRDLTGKIEAAKARLATVPKSKQTAIRAEISQLQAALARARAALASLHDRTVTVSVRTLLSTAPARVRQHGGPTAAGQPYVVGEKGPELFIPRTAGTVIPNDRLPAMGGITWTGDVNVYPSQGMSERRVAQLVVDVIDERARRARKGPRA